MTTQRISLKAILKMLRKGEVSSVYVELRDDDTTHFGGELNNHHDVLKKIKEHKNLCWVRGYFSRVETAKDGVVYVAYPTKDG